jgi:hypothetical protein
MPDTPQHHTSDLETALDGLRQVVKDISGCNEIDLPLLRTALKSQYGGGREGHHALPGGESHGTAVGLGGLCAVVLLIALV